MTSGFPGTPEIPSPSIARVYDYALGGKDNHEPDRRLFERILTHYPRYQAGARANRVFLQRSVTYLAERGIRQFVDLGSGIPTPPNVHDVAQAVHPDARVVYVDKDDTAYVHGRAWLTKCEGVEYLQHDVEDVEAMLGRPELSRTVDLSEPVAVLAYAVLHFVPDDVVTRIIDQLRRATAPGSMLALSIASPSEDHLARTGVDVTAMQMSREWGGQMFLRSPERVRSLVADLALTAPGLVDVQDWPEPHPDPLPDLHWLAAVAELHGTGAG